MSHNSKLCLTCQHPLNGRIDKKFCDDYCRSAYNNRKYLHEKGCIRKVNHYLLRNRRILEAFATPAPRNAVLKEKLYNNGFQFNYFTHTYVCEDGFQYFCCYDHAYRNLSNNELLIIKLDAGKENHVTLCIVS